MRLKMTVATAVVVAVAGCASNLPSSSTAPPLGPEPNAAEAERVVLAYLKPRLKDPDSLKQFQLLLPAGMCTYLDTLAAGDLRWESGWSVGFEYNAKNSYGAYPGLARGRIVVRCSAANACWFFSHATAHHTGGC